MARGVIEQAIDEELSDRRLELSYNTFKKYEEEGVLESAESAMFGKVYSEAFSYFIYFKMHSRELIKLQEVEEFEKVIERRVCEIKGKIVHLSVR